MRDNIILEMKNITKEFPGVKALQGVDFSVAKGEIHALMGENGAGKSTLIKILTGIYSKDSGTITFEGKDINPTTSLEAQQLGISPIYQELNLIPYLSICENIFLGREIKKGHKIDWKQTKKEAEKILNNMGIDIDVTQNLNTQSTAIQQMVSIARALAINAKLVVMDEPTSSLDKKEVKILFEVIKNLQKRNIAIIFISHKLDEVYEICDKITILKDGELEGEYMAAELPEIELISKMIGRDAKEITERPKSNYIPDSNQVPICELEGISNYKLRDIDLSIKKGEVIGLAGLLGSGRTEIAKTIFGADLVESGNIKVNGEEIRIKNQRDAIKEGFALCPEDRRMEGIIPNMSVRENITLVLLPKLSKLGIVNRKKQDQIVDKFIKDLGIRTPHAQQKVKNLSGGNQQKVVLARWLCTTPKMVILDEPTRGIDVGAKGEIEQIIRELAKDGLGVLMISSEMAEVVRNSDRVAVMRDGRKIKELLGEDINQDNIMVTIAEGHEAFDGGGIESE